ncbi:ABC transporter permease [Leadbetterella sp. DM7]|uniref:ABC transporter permease n=1 Tax=Leadbetterella sp. DM7 TaxID=3235085 RepID=UPI00349ED018
MLFLRLTLESFRFAWQALRSNILRTVLSLLGVTVGIFSIIGVYTMVDSLETNVKAGLSSIGSQSIYIEKFPWGIGESEYPWWKYFMRPQPTYREFRSLKNTLKEADAITIMSWNSAIAKRKSNSFSSLVQGVSFEYDLINETPIEKGRYFLEQETDAARPVAILGASVAETLFGDEDPINQRIKVKGENFTVIGVVEKKGKQMLDVGGNPDDKIFIPFLKHKRMFSSGNLTGTIQVKARDVDGGLETLESEVKGQMRTLRGLKPLADDNFALNRPDALVNFMTTIFSSIRTGGFVIGLFALLIGGFGIANIMFVSVKERTNIIGIQKSLGAKNFFILFQFLFEAVFLCLLGGLIGLLLVYMASFIQLGTMDIVLTPSNMIFGLVISSVIGVVAGLIPAFQAANMDPVIAIRAK